MVKQGAKGGFVVTTSDFTTSAKEYCDGLNIKLINGEELVEIWAKSLETEVEMAKGFVPQPV